MKLALTLLLSVLLQSSPSYTVTVLSPNWINISWHTTQSTAVIKVYRNDRLSQTSAMPSNYDAVWTFNAYAGDRVTVVEYADHGITEVARFTTDPIPTYNGPVKDPIWMPLIMR